MLRVLAIFLRCFEDAIELALSKYLKSFGFKEFTGAEGSVKRQDFFYELEAYLLSTKPPHQKFYFATTCGPLRKQLFGPFFVA